MFASAKAWLWMPKCGFGDLQIFKKFVFYDIIRSGRTRKDHANAERTDKERRTVRLREDVWPTGVHVQLHPKFIHDPMLPNER